jgi:hypothetical protein
MTEARALPRTKLGMDPAWRPFADESPGSILRQFYRGAPDERTLLSVPIAAKPLPGLTPEELTAARRIERQRQFLRGARFGQKHTPATLEKMRWIRRARALARTPGSAPDPKLDADCRAIEALLVQDGPRFPGAIAQAMSHLFRTAVDRRLHKLRDLGRIVWMPKGWAATGTEDARERSEGEGR